MNVMSKEAVCTYSLITLIDGIRIPVACDHKECLFNKVWNGNGVKAAAAETLEVPVETIGDTIVNGIYVKCPQLHS